MKKRIVVLTGAGVSAESGISTFRDSGGLWDNYNVEDVASIEGWKRNPSLVLDFYNIRRTELKDKHPNDAHLAIASLQSAFDLSVITQNVDNLHERAGQVGVIHLHGELTKVRPESGLYDRTFSEEEVFDIGYEPIQLGDKAPNGSQLRPHIVWFGEAVPKIEQAVSMVEKAEILLIVGTSLSVYPAAGLYRYAGRSVPIYIIDPGEMSLRDARVSHIRKTATQGMKDFCEKLFWNGFRS